MWELDREQRHDRHGANRDPGDRNRGDAPPGQPAIAACRVKTAGDRLSFAKPSHRLFDRVIFSQALGSKLGHAIIEVVPDLRDGTAARPPPEWQSATQFGEDLYAWIGSNLELLPQRA